MSGISQAGFIFLEHPADMGIEAWGDTVQEAFRQAAIGMMSIIIDLSGVNVREVKIINLNAMDIEQLLVKWLGEILYLYDGRKFVIKHVNIRNISDTNLSAEVGGEAADPDRHKFKMDIKAVTYHQISIQKERNSTRIRVFFDI